MKISIVTTMYHSVRYLNEFYARMSKTVQSITKDYEIIFVNDGSPDNSLDTALQFQKTDDRIVVIDLSRNFGHHKAVMAGLSFAQGDLVFLIDCDLEEDPENLALFHETLSQAPDCDVVYGVQKVRKGTVLNKITARLFYKVMNFLSDEKLDPDMVFSRLMSRRYVQSLLRFTESELFLVGLWKITGYTQRPVTIQTRSKGTSTYTFRKKVTMAINAITSFSNMPLIAIFYLGLLIVISSCVYIMYFLLRKIIFGDLLSGWTSLIISVWMNGGLIILFMGIIGIYLSRIFIETKSRPFVIVKHEYRKNVMSGGLLQNINPEASERETYEKTST